MADGDYKDWCAIILNMACYLESPSSTIQECQYSKQPKELCMFKTTWQWPIQVKTCSSEIISFCNFYVYTNNNTLKRCAKKT